MPKLSDLTIVQMRASSKAQIIASIRDYLTANMTKHQLIVMLRDRETVWDDAVDTYYPDGQIESRNEIERDEDTLLQVSRRLTTWTYYNTGEVNVILIQTFDADDALKKTKRIKHYRDGRQPEGNGVMNK